MARALLALHEATGEEAWLEQALALARVAHERFALPGGGYADSTAEDGVPAAFAGPVTALESSAEVARLFLDVGALTGEPAWRGRALSAIGRVADAERLEGHGRQVGGLLLAVEAALAPWALVKVEGPADDPRALALWARARRLALGAPDLRRLRRVTAATTPARALVCTASTCLDPVEEAEDLDLAVARALGPALGSSATR
jgi:uncharacterized protein YyaL (SSP411 family)